MEGLSVNWQTGVPPAGRWGWDLVHDGLDLLDGQPLVVRLVVRTSHPTGGTDLDDICALSQESSDADAHLVDGVDQFSHAVGRVEPARRGEIAVAAGVA
jgi:hypothetical protein